MTLKIGLAEITITPPVGIALAGYMPRASPSVGVNDDLHARAITFSDGENSAALVILEFVMVPNEVVKKVRDLISPITSIKPEHVLISAIHTHSGPGPAMFGVSHREGFDDVFKAYIRLLPYHVAGLIYTAFLHQEDSELVLGIKEGVAIGHHRRAWDQTTNFVDTELLTLCIERAGKPVGCVYNIGCHPVKMNPDNFYISADFPGYTTKALKGVYGTTFVPIFMPGPAGNINPWNQPFTNPKSTFEECAVLGNFLAGEIMASMGKAEPLDVAMQVNAGEVLVKIPIEPSLEGSEDDDDFVITKVQAIVLGDRLSIVGLPGEPFSKFGRLVKDGVKTKHCMVHELNSHDLVNQDRIAYIPTKEAYLARDEAHPAGGYEVATAIPNPNTGQILVDAAISLVNRLIELGKN
ncbi:MAG: hypothetical protein ACTSUE_13625 [Promethearchaeota archaeon]